MDDIRKVGVVGAGLMGSQIAAHITNAGIPVVLLDIVPEGAEDRNVVAKGALEKMKKADPAPFMHRRNANLITVGNLEDDLDLLNECDWIIEAVVENPKVKYEIFQKIDKHRKPGSVVSSNTSTIPIQYLTQYQTKEFKQDFMVTHFFNPPRYMRLLESVVSPDTRPEAAAAVRQFCDVRMGKAVVECKDSPAFIANRIGTFWIQAGFNAALDLDLSVEEADAVAGKPMGAPKTGIFGLMDLVGIDLMPKLAKSLKLTLPEDDEYRNIHREPDFVKEMIDSGYTGRKGEGGFYRLNKEGGKKVKEARNLKTGDYAPADKPKLESIAAGKDGLHALVMHPDKGGQYAKTVLLQTLWYAATVAEQLADDIMSIDRAMMTGFAWKYGPFEMMDQIGVDNLIAMITEADKPVPKLLDAAKGQSFYKVENGQLHYLGFDGKHHPVKRPDGVLLLQDVKRASEPVLKNASAAVWDIGDGVLCLEFRSKMNAIDLDILKMVENLATFIPESKGQYKALVIHNEADNFSVGANLGLAMFAINVGLYEQIDEIVKGGQRAYEALKYAPFPVVGAPSGMALGGGCEIMLHTDAVQAHAETYIGLVEVGVGLIPGWGGCKEMILRTLLDAAPAGGAMPGLRHVFETISVAKVAKSAQEAMELLYFRPDVDQITMNKDRVLFEAKQRALGLVDGYHVPEKRTVKLPGETAYLAFKMAVDDFHKAGKATKHDVVVSDALAKVLSGGNTDILDEITEERLLELEQREFMKLIYTDDTLDRIEHMLTTGKPLRN